MASLSDYQDLDGAIVCRPLQTIRQRWIEHKLLNAQEDLQCTPAEAMEGELGIHEPSLNMRGAAGPSLRQILEADDE